MSQANPQHPATGEILLRRRKLFRMIMSQRQGKIAVLGLSYPFRGGIAHYSTLLVRELRKKHAVKFITLRRQYPELLFPGKTQYDPSARGLTEENHALIDSVNPASWLKAALTLKREKVDLVVVQWWNPFFGLAFGTIANLLTLLSDSKICFLCHNVLPHESTVVDRMLSKYAFLTSNYFIVHSDEDRCHLLSMKPRAVVRKNVHPTYAIFGDFSAHEKSQARSELGIPPDKKTLLFFGLIRPYKGLKYLIQAMADVTKSIDCVLLVVGEFYESKEEYLSLIRQLGLEQYIVIRDEYVKNEAVSLYFSSADVVVLPYVTATQSGIVQIAFGLNKPVITTNVGGLPEAVEDGKTGFVVDPASSDQLAEAILKFYQGNYEAEFSERIRENSHAFSWDAEVSSIESFLADQPA
jgi:glycosyltransferase involved in cell wall biosynthesis